MYKICFTASTGGHFEQIMMLKPLMDNYESFVITEMTKYKVEIDNINFYYINQVNRKEFMCFIKLISIFFRTLKIFEKERPTHIISTGALSTIPVCIAGKIMGSKIIYIESFAKITSATLTGKLMYKFADEFIVQWEEMKKVYPKAKFWGGIY